MGLKNKSGSAEPSLGTDDTQKDFVAFFKFFGFHYFYKFLQMNIS